MEQWLPEENLEQGSADYEELAANNGVVVTDSEDHLLSMFYGGNDYERRKVPYLSK